MFRLNRKTEYALMALQHLQNLPPGIRVSARSVANRIDVPDGLVAGRLEHLADLLVVQLTRLELHEALFA